MSGKSEIRLYQSVANRLIEDIANGVYPVGSHLLPESELAQLFGVSRYTLREALRYLQQLGLVSRRQGHGTVVQNAQPARQSQLTIGTFSDIENHGMFTHMSNIRKDVIEADEILARTLPCEVGERFLRINCQRLPNDMSVPLPPAINQTYIHEPYMSLGDQIGIRFDGALYMLLEQQFSERVLRIDQEVSAVLLEPRQSEILNVPKGSVGLRIKRQYFSRADRQAMVAFNIYPGDHFSLNMRFQQD